MNKRAHAAGAGIAVALAAYYEAREGRDRLLTVEKATGNVLASGAVAALCGSLPDIFEPAIRPNHRQFFHSVVCGTALFAGLRQVYRWQPDDDWQRLLRNLTLIAGASYLVHLAMDATNESFARLTDAKI